MHDYGYCDQRKSSLISIFKPAEFFNMSTEDWRNLSAPLKANGKFDQCNIFNLNYTNLGENELFRPNEDTSIMPCTEWEFATEPFTVRFEQHNISET